MSQSPSSVVRDQRIELTRNRRAIANVMAASAVVPQFCVDAEVNLSKLLELRSSAISPPSIGDAVLRAVVLALGEHPELNASFDDEAILRHGAVQLGVGIIGPEGLMIVVVREAQSLTVEQLAAERKRLTAAATAGTLRGEEVLGATFVVSNLGPAGVRRFQALVVPPAACILAVGAMHDRVRVAGGGAIEEQAANLCLSCDHRVLDGMDAARFIATLARLLEEPEELASWT